MRIAFTGGGTGGHFYPIIAVAQALQDVIKEQKLLDPELYYLAPEEYDKKALYNYGIEFRYVPSGKKRTYFSVLNYLDYIKVLLGCVKALVTLWRIYPDVLFSKGGYVSFPVVWAARVLRIPIVIHESDSVPGRANRWAGKYAEKIALSYSSAGEYFDTKKVALTGNPIRKELLYPQREGAREHLKLSPTLPVILVLGGSQGASKINQTILDALPKLVEHYQVIHQVGSKNIEEVESIAKIVLEDSTYASRYKPFAFLNEQALRMAAGSADVVITRAGSTLFEVAAWGVPSIVVPITESNGDHQRKNAYALARSGGCIVIEESNFTDDILIAQINELLSNKERYDQMSSSAQAFAPRDAAYKIAKVLTEIALSHEQ